MYENKKIFILGMARSGYHAAKVLAGMHNEIVLSEELAGYCLMYRAVHGDDDTIEPEE